MSDIYEITETIKNITIDGTNAYLLETIITGIGLLAFVYVACLAYKQLARIIESWADEHVADLETKKERAKNTLYLEGLYTAYKAGVVTKAAVEGEVEMISRPEDKVKSIDEVLNDQVKKEISE